MFPATNNRPGTHQRKKGVILSIPFRKTPKSKERKGEGRGRGGTKLATGCNEPCPCSKLHFQRIPVTTRVVHSNQRGVFRLQASLRKASGREREREREREKVKRGKKERKKERKREEENGRGEKRKRQVFPATNNRPGTHQRKKGVILSIPFRKTPKSKERQGEGRGRAGLSSRQVPMNLEQALVAATHVRLARGLPPLTAVVTLKAWARQTSHFLWHKPSAVRCGHLHLRAGEMSTNPRSTGPREALCGLIPGRPNTLMDMRTDLIAVPHAGLGFQFLRVPVRTIGAWGSRRSYLSAE